MRSRRLLEWVAALLSVAAGIIHLQFGPIHLDEDPLHGAFFYVVGFAQLGTAVLVVGLRRRSQLLVWAMIAGNLAVAALWAQTRFVGVPLGAGAGGREAIGLGDTAATALELALVLTLLPLVSRVRLAALTDRSVSTRAAGAALTTVAVIALPLMAAASVLGPDAHSHGGHGHGEAAHGADAHDHGHGATEVALGDHTHAVGEDHVGDDATDHAHDDALAHDGAAHDGAAHDEAAHGDTAGATHDDAGHSHVASTTHPSDDHPHPPGSPTGTHPPGEPPHDHPPADEPPHTHPPGDPPTGPVIAINDPRLTPAQRQAARALITSTRSGMAKYATVAAVTAGGYTSIGDGGAAGYEHFVNWSYLQDGRELDPTRIESIVAKKNGDGTKTVVSAMYILELGKAMSDVPPIAGELTSWHDHRNLCWEGNRLVGTLVNGKCTRGVLRVTPPMLHVWMVPHPCGPFAAIDGHGSGCGHTH